MHFQSDLPYREPDGEYYAQLKHIAVVDHQPGEAFNGDALGGGFDVVRDIVGPDRFDLFYGPRLRLAARNVLGRDFVARFPGTHVPDLGNRGVLRSLGSLAYDRFRYTAGIRGGVLCDPEEHVFTLEPTPRATLWPWRTAEPELVTIIPAPTRPIVSLPERLAWETRLRTQSDPLEVISTAWSSHTRVLGKDHGLKHVHGDPAFLFELEDTLACVSWSAGRRCVGRGFSRGCYLEVYLCALGEIRNTEIAQTPRVLQELRSLIHRGFAPIVMNEYGANVDGTHRQTACWLWNLLYGLRVDDLHLTSETLHVHVQAFVTEHAQTMGPVTVREVLRILAEFVADPESRLVLEREILPSQSEHVRVQRLPVLFLREASWPTVRYREYLGGERAVRVDPLVYERMADDPKLVLPAHGQGPYHLTDRELIYWFDVLAINRL